MQPTPSSEDRIRFPIQSRNASPTRQPTQRPTPSADQTHHTLIPILYTNAISLYNKMAELQDRVCDYQPHIIAITETWLRSCIDEAEVDLPGHTMIGADRQQRSPPPLCRLIPESNALNPPAGEPTVCQTFLATSLDVPLHPTISNRLTIAS